MDHQFLDIYTDYLLVSFRHTAATTLASMSDGQISHDKVTRFLRSEEFSQKDLWKYVKPAVRECESDHGFLVFDDSIAAKPYTDENEIVTYHWDHIRKTSVKGINFITALYVSKNARLPVGYEIFKKTIMTSDEETGLPKRKAATTKHELVRNLLKQCRQNRLKYARILADSYYCASETINFIHNQLNKKFIIAMKSNRMVALSRADRNNGIWVRVDSLKLKKGVVQAAYIKGVDFPLRIVREVFKHEHRSAGIQYLITNDSRATYERITADYRNRWRVEEFHKSLKHNASLAKAPVKIVRTQHNDFFASMCAYIKLEKMRSRTRINHFAIKAKLYLNALKASSECMSGFTMA